MDSVDKKCLLADSVFDQASSILPGRERDIRLSLTFYRSYNNRYSRE